MRMAGDISVNRNCSSGCVICLQEISNLQNTTQPTTPRKVFKACVSYLKPEIFPKYSKWDFLSDLERQSPFCSMCASSGEKLSALNDRLEELQKEIRNFVKFFTKDVQLLRSNDEDDDENEDFGDKGEQEEGLSKISLRSHSRQINLSPNTSKGDPSCENGIKVENEDLDLDNEDEDYTAPSTEEDDIEEDESYIPKKTKVKEKSKDVPDQTRDEVLKPKSKRINRYQWKEVPYSDEKLKQDWNRRTSKIAKHYVTEYFSCKLGGRKCPAMMMKRSYMGVHYYENGKAHQHSKNELHGISRDIKLVVRKILDHDPNAKPIFVLDTLKLNKGIVLQKTKLANLLKYEKRKILIKNGLYEKPTSPPVKSDTPGKRKRGRPPGSLNKFIPPPNNSIPVPINVNDNTIEIEPGENMV